MSTTEIGIVSAVMTLAITMFAGVWSASAKITELSRDVLHLTAAVNKLGLDLEAGHHVRDLERRIVRAETDIRDLRRRRGEPSSHDIDSGGGDG